MTSKETSATLRTMALRSHETPARSVKPLSSAFVVVLVVVSLAVFVAPFARAKLMLYMARSYRSSAPVHISGNSIMGHVSLCDKDTRTLPEMITSLAGVPVLDNAFGGQPLDESLNFAALSLKNTHTQTVLIGLSLPALSAYSDVDMQQYLLDRLANPTLALEGVASRLRGGGINGRLDPFHDPFTYGGHSYPDYNGIKARYFEPQRQIMPCPESDSTDAVYLEAYYHHAYFDFDLKNQNFQILKSLHDIALAHHKQLLVVLMPLDYQLMNRLHAGMGDQALSRAREYTSLLQQQGLQVLDASAHLQNEDFADRYCACGHLVESGRQKLSREIAAMLNRHGLSNPREEGASRR